MSSNPASPSLTFEDFLPDDRTPERVRLDMCRDRIAGLIADEDRRGRWPAWKGLLIELRSTTEVERAVFDLALRQELGRIAQAGDALPRKVLGLIFTEMGWWSEDTAYPKREAQLRTLERHFQIAHLRPEDVQEPAPKTDLLPMGFGKVAFWMVAAFVVILLIS